MTKKEFLEQYIKECEKCGFYIFSDYYGDADVLEIEDDDLHWEYIKEKLREGR
jgi:hypothetical protein